MRGEVGAIRRGEANRIVGDYPREVSPLAQEMNLLVDANHEIIDRARTQVGNLAHALKTPLSVIVNEAGSDDSPLAGKVREQATIMRDQVQYYLDRARAAARAAAVGSVTDVEPVVAALVRTFEKITRDQGLAFSAEIAAGSRFRGERQDLEEMIGNLVDNASKWTATRVHIGVAPGVPLGPDRPSLTITIDDDGPGLAEDKRQEATRRGRRLDETKPGSGLGLSIVSDLASLYGGRLELDDAPGGGLRARLVLPAV
jgi:signal transduction histidine kinase